MTRVSEKYESSCSGTHAVWVHPYSPVSIIGKESQELLFRHHFRYYLGLINQALYLAIFASYEYLMTMLTPTPLEGRTQLATKHWQCITSFINGLTWQHQAPATPEDLDDPLTHCIRPYGAFMLGFDFHLSHNGPKLIEINTNAGGFAALIETCPDSIIQKQMKEAFVKALVSEFEKNVTDKQLKHVVILDDDITNQWLYPEMKYFSELLRQSGLIVSLATPDKLKINNNIAFCLNSNIDFIYNRLVDFRLTEPAHIVLRTIMEQGLAVVSPNPSTYVRIADKRLLRKKYHPIVPEAFLLSDKTFEEWEPIRKKFVFKPLTGAASKGVYRGDRISLKKLAELPPDTLVQELVPAPYATDGTKYDIRVFTCGSTILGVASRHFNGQVMEMRTPGSGIRWVDII